MKKILIVEDDTILLSTLTDNLTEEGFEIIKAEDGEKALASALNMKPDLILLDILLPKMDGLTMMKKLREENEWGKKVPIILLTNLYANDEKINQAIADNMPAYYLTKSNYTIEDLVEKIRERLSRPV